MQIDDKVVSFITKELLKRLGQDFFSSDPGEAEKVPLVIIGGSSSLGAAALSAAENRYSITAQETLEPDFADNVLILVTKLSIQALVRVAEGDPGCTPEGHGLLWAILRGKKAFVLEEGIEWRRFSTQMPRALHEKYAACEQKLASYGVKIIREADIGAVLSTGSSGKAALSAPLPPVQGASSISVNPGTKRVITELELSQLCPVSKGKGQTLLVGSADIITPLARDYITAMSITVSKST
jgi:ethanolamine utilization protein